MAMDRRDFFRRTAGTLTAAVLFGRTLKAGTLSLKVDNPMFQPGDVLHVPRTRENFIVSFVDEGGKITFSRPLENTVRSDDEIILIGNTGVEGNTTKSGWLERERRRCLFKGKELKRGESDSR